jgi:predicted O-linked N-acetylglucosamine transferase (SPINDLY family)
MQSEFDEARKYLQLAVANQPDYADAYNELGIVLLQCEQLNEARASFQKALDCKPDYPIASNNLGIVFRALGKLKEAQACFENAIALDTAYIDPYVNLANMCAAASFFREAAECFGKALELNPESANLHYGKGNALYSMGDMEQARTQYSEALALRPAFWEAKFALAVATLPAVFRIGDKPDEIREAFAQAVTELHSLPDRGTITGDVPLVVTQPFFLAYQEHDNRALLSRFGALLIRLMRNWLDLTGCEREPPAAAGMIRLGLISAHIRNQSVWTAIVKGWFQHLDKSAFELHVFHLSPRCDKETEWAIANSNSFRQCPDNLKTCAREIWAKNLDVLIYPEIGMDPPTVTLATLRLAPVQVAAWGHPETTGLSTVDYYLSAEDFEPVGAQNYYSERLVLLPHLGCCYQPLGTTDAAPDFAHLKIDASLPILLCPGVPQKYAPQHDNVWAEIARRLGKCQLVFFSLSDDIKAARLRERLIVTFESAGLKLESHAVFAPWLNRPTFFGLMKRSTLMLDTLGFSGFNTAIQAIECGLPLVTLEGHFMRGRLASGILRRMGIDELIAKDESTYIELVVRLVRDEAFNRRMRNRIEETRGVLFGDLAPIRAMEDFFRQVATRH